MKEFTIQWFVGPDPMRNIMTCMCDELDEAIDIFADEAIEAMAQEIEDFGKYDDIDFLESEGIVFNSDGFDDVEIGQLIVTSEGGYDFISKVM